MDFQRLLLHIGRSLDSHEVKALTFLCTDLSQRSLSSVGAFSDLCSSLSDQGLLSADRPQLLQDLLLTIGRQRLVRDLQLTDQGPGRSLVSPYRKLLYNLSEEITDEDLRHIKFLLSSDLPRRKLDENITTLELFLELEQLELLGQNNLDLLQLIFASVCPVLNEKINRFKEQHEAMSRHVYQNQHDLNDNPRYFSEGSNVSNVQSFPHPAPSVSLPNASLDFPRGSHGDTAVLPQQCVSEANAGTNSSPGKGTCGGLKTSEESTLKILKNPINMFSGLTNVEEIGTYSMTAAIRGICLIVNNYNFVYRPREGTQIDQICLEEVFQWLGFKVEVHHDCTRDKMLSVAQELSSRDHRNMDCVVCCFLSHGLEDGLYGVDDKTVSIRQLTRLFNGSQCPSLVDKPKLFFIQACQGTKEQQAVSIEADGPTPCSIEVDAAKLFESIPSDADFLLGMATVPSFVSYRERSNGSWFIQALCKNLVQMVPRGQDLVSILTKVNADVSKKTVTKKQMPQPSLTLRKKVIFPVPSLPPPNLWPL